jgi:nitroreductase
MMFIGPPEHTTAAEPFSPEDVAMLLRAASAAPSLYNSQPWRFMVTDHEVRVFVDPERRSPIADPNGRQQVIACGAALFNLRLAIRHLGYQPQVSLWPSRDDQDHLATIRRGAVSDAGAAERKLYAQIYLRHTNREYFGTRAIWPAARQVARYAAATESGWLRPVDSPADRAAVTNLIVRAIRSQRADHSLGTEMARWLHADRSAEGMPVAAWRSAQFPVPGLDERADNRDWERAIAREVDTQSFFVLATPRDTPTAWLTAGQALQRALLAATQLDLAASFFNQVVEMPELRSELAERLDMNAWPQMILRLGYPGYETNPATQTGRRDLADIITDD